LMVLTLGQLAGIGEPDFGSRSPILLLRIALITA